MLKQAIVDMVAYMRQNPEKTFELEARLGMFNMEENLQFSPGFIHDHMILVKRFMQRIERNPVLKPETWKIAEDKHYLLRCEYRIQNPDGSVKQVRQTCKNGAKPHEANFIEKKNYGKIDIQTNRLYKARISLSTETPLTPTPPTLLKQAPDSIRYIQRASFFEFVPSLFPGLPDFPELQFRWDISKVGASAPNKLKATELPCSYHVEVELVTILKPMADKVREQAHNELVAESFLCRIQAFLGLYTTEGKAIAPATLSLLQAPSVNYGI